MDIGINYITELDFPQNKYDKIYEFLIQKGIINTLKFPGKYCNYDTLESFMKLAIKTEAKIDIHGIPGMVPAIHSQKCIENIEWEKVQDKLQVPQRISTHMGLDNKEKILNYQQGTFENNISKIKEELHCLVGLENIPGGFEFDAQTITPEFITENWENADFGVFDISHAKLAAKDLGITYEEYLERLDNKDKVEILHISGNIDETRKYLHKPDKHIIINESEIKDIIDLFNEFENVNLVISEYAYNSKYSYEKELIIEAEVLRTIVETRDEEMVRRRLNFLQENLKDDISNLEKIIY